MRNIKGLNKISLLTIGATALTFGNISQSHAQVYKAQTTHNLNLRSGASTANTIILTIKKGTKVEVLKSLGEWSKVKHQSTIGYVSSQYLTKVTDENNTSNNENKDQPDKIKIMECGTDILNVRFGPSTSEKVLGKLKKGD
ncbi:MAG: SH3 domain-containing protein, partial [Peptostreptococcaceae bacterium]